MSSFLENAMPSPYPLSGLGEGFLAGDLCEVFALDQGFSKSVTGLCPYLIHAKVWERDLDGRLTHCRRLGLMGLPSFGGGQAGFHDATQADIIEI
jgi:hypothetical protein